MLNTSLKPLFMSLVAGVVAFPVTVLTTNFVGWQQNSSSIGFSSHPLAAQAADCIANNNLGEVANNFIGRCRKGSIRQEFPGELLNKTLGTIKAGNDAKSKKAWKLLNDRRFLK